MNDDDDLVERLLTKAGAMLEDASAIAISRSPISVPDRIAIVGRAAEGAAMLVAAANLIVGR